MVSLDQVELVNLLNQVSFDIVDAVSRLRHYLLAKHQGVSQSYFHLVESLLFVLECQMQP